MKRRILWLLVCMLLCTTMAACARREAPQLPTAEVQTQPETPEPTQETEPSQAPEEPDQAVSAHGSAAYIHGRTLVVSIFADDAATHWDETTDADDIDQTQEHLRIATEWLTDAVKPYGVTAEFFYDWKEDPDLRYSAKFTETLVRADGSMYDVQAGYIQENIPTEELKRAYDADNVVYFFFFKPPYEGTPSPWSLGRLNSQACDTELVNLFSGRQALWMSRHLPTHMSCSHAFGVPDLYYTGGLIPQAYVDYCKETGSQDIMYTINGDMDRITGQLTELDAYYLGLTARPAEADRCRSWASASTRGNDAASDPIDGSGSTKKRKARAFRFFRYDL